MKLELKHLAPYLPYGLKCILIQCLKDDFYESDDWVDDIEIFSKGTIWTYSGYADEDLLIPLGDGDFSGFLIRHGNSYTSVGNSVKPILRPLSDLIKDKYLKQFFREERNLIDHEMRITNNKPIPEFFSYKIMVKLFEWHIDVFGLIPKGLAIDINKL